jgi:hypothetical protein
MGDNRDRIELRTTVVIFGSFPGFLGGDPEKDDASDYEVFDKNDPEAMASRDRVVTATRSQVIYVH